MKYSLEEVRQKVEAYTGDKEFSVNPKMIEVDNLTKNITDSIKKACRQNKLKYHDTFDQVINHLEGAILSSKNWFYKEGLDYKKIKDFVNLRCIGEESFLNDFELKNNIIGTKNCSTVNNIEIISMAQANRFQADIKSIHQWHFLKCLRLRSISIEDNSDAYMDNIDLKAVGKNVIIKKFSNNYQQSTLLIAIKHHSFTSTNDDYSPMLEKFELILVKTKKD